MNGLMPWGSITNRTVAPPQIVACEIPLLLLQPPLRRPEMLARRCFDHEHRLFTGGWERKQGCTSIGQNIQVYVIDERWVREQRHGST